jgi:putative endonuclease
VPPDRRQAIGRFGEDLACTELAQRGYAILARRYRTRYGEIDIVARDGDTIVIVEVKTRVGKAFGGGAAAVTRFKQHQMMRMGTDYLARRRLTGSPCRFDVVEVDLEAAEPRIEIYRNAFDVGAA